MTEGRVGVFSDLGAVGVRELVAASRDVGVELVWLVGRETPPALSRLLTGLGDVVPFDEAKPVLAAPALRTRDVSGVVALSDAQLVACADVAHELGLPGLSPDTARLARRKWSQRTTLNEAGVGLVETVRVARESADRSRADVSFPAILKRDAGTGGVDATLVTSPAALEELVRELPAGEDFVLETLIASRPHPASDRLGPVLSLDSAVARGTIRHFGVIDRFPHAPPFRETGAVWPSTLPSIEQRRVEEVAESAIRALGIDDAVTHIELQLTPSVATVIEVNARLGGYVDSGWRRAGVGSPLNAALSICQGLDVPAPRKPDRVVMLRLVQPPQEATRLVAAPPAVALLEIPGVWRADAIRSPGAALDWRVGAPGRIFDVWLDAPSHDELWKRADLLDAVLTSSVRYE
jgi:predicted ATP-grasp superfamily ATP-dependent carboligase